MNALFVAWRSGEDHNGAWGPVGRLDYDGHLFRFCYTRGARTLPGFRPFQQMERFGQVYESESLFPLFANRLLLRSRPEYEDFLRWGGFDPANPPGPIAVLGVTEGIRQTDAIEVFPCPVPDSAGCYVNRFFLHGIRWAPVGAVERINRLRAGDRLAIVPDPNNPADPNAVAIHFDNPAMRIGFFPRYLAHDAARLLAACDPLFVSVVVDRVNRQAPLQNRVLCRMEACWPDGFQPCSDEAFLPIPQDVPARC